MSSGTHILLLETATKICSVAVACNGEVVAFQEETSDQYIHAEKLNVFIQQVLDEADITIGDLDAVCVSKGPGSYTGLRIGISAAKGLCFALGIPLLSVGTLKAIAVGFYADPQSEGMCCPMLDARRMEVYSAVYDKDLHEVSAVDAVVIDMTSYEQLLPQGPLFFVGDGAEKCRSELTHKNAHFNIAISSSARWMATLAQARYDAGQYEDLAYFTPFYLKEYKAGKKVGST